MSNPGETSSKAWRQNLGVIRRLSLVAMLLRTGLARRGQHPKQHASVRATFEVLDDIPAAYKIGLFAKPGTYHTLIRFSNGPQEDDREQGPLGMAIKVLGVPGEKILPAEADATTHDFIMIDGPTFFVRNIESYARLFKELSRLKPGAKPEKWLAWVAAQNPKDVEVAENYHNRVADSSLARPYWSQVPYAWGTDGKAIARYSVQPHPGNMPASIPPQFRDKDYLRETMVGHLTRAAKPAGFDFYVQLGPDATEATIENPTVEWTTPVQKVAVVTIPPQEFDRPDRIRFGQSLSFNPWHALPEHRPLGQMNEIRRVVYVASSKLRHFFSLTRRREPTSVEVPPAPSAAWKMAWILTAVFALSGLAIAAAKIGPSLFVSVPTYPAVERQVWQEQNWSPAAREWYHHAHQGGQFPPMINVPFEWFVALEQPNRLWGSAGLLADQTYLDRFGFIPSTTESGAYDWRHCGEPKTDAGYGSKYDSGTGSPTWRHKLPVGFACSDAATDPMLQPDGRPWRHAATDGQLSAIGLTCAACHTGRLTYGKTELLIDGGSAMTDIVKLNTAIGLSLFFTKMLPARFDRFALRLLGPDANDASRAVLKRQLDQVVGRVAALKKLDDGVKKQSAIEGFGRLDALNRIGNQVFSIDLDRPENYAGSSAPVHYPRIWDMPWLEWAQYNASIGQPMVRNAGEALGTGGNIALLGTRPGANDLTAPLFSSTVKFETLHEMEKLLAGSQPDAAKGFTGLRAPKWPAEILGPIDQKLAEKGAKLYADICQHCHLPPTKSAAFWNDEYWTKPNAAGQRYLITNVIPIEEVGTDEAQAADLLKRTVKTPPELGLTTDSFGPALGELVGKAVERWYNVQKVPPDERREMDGHRPNEVRAPLAYKARPLEGVWAAPPYLHNGSVPSIQDLLTPPDERPKSFWLGHREYDPMKLGYRTDRLSGGFEYDTSVRGNTNTGHEFNDGYKPGGPNRKGLIGPRLSPDDRKALIEFLKSM